MKTHTLSSVHERAGARLRTGPCGLEVLTYGDVPAEYRASQESAILFDCSARGCVELGGSERLQFLHRVTANAVKGLAAGSLARNLLLSSKGKVQFVFELAVEAECVRLSTEPGQASALLRELDKYLFTEPVTLRDASEEHAPLELAGPGAAAVVERAFAHALPPNEGQQLCFGSGEQRVRLARLRVAGLPGVRVEPEPAALESSWRRLIDAGARPSGRVLRDILRVEALEAQWGDDIDENVYPQEARLESAFSLDKGCYIGQEVVAKIDTYGGLNKRLVALRVSHDDPVARGTPLFRLDEGEWRELGLVTSWAYSFALDGGLCLAYVKRRHQEPGTVFRLGAGPATATLVEAPRAAPAPTR